MLCYPYLRCDRRFWGIYGGRIIAAQEEFFAYQRYRCASVDFHPAQRHWAHIAAASCARAQQRRLRPLVAASFRAADRHSVEQAIEQVGLRGSGSAQSSGNFSKRLLLPSSNAGRVHLHDCRQ